MLLSPVWCPLTFLQFKCEPPETAPGPELDTDDMTRLGQLLFGPLLKPVPKGCEAFEKWKKQKEDEDPDAPAKPNIRGASAPQLAPWRPA